MLKIVPMGKVSRDILSEIASSLREAFSEIEETEICEEIEVPAVAYDEDRKQYKARVLLEYLRSKKTAEEGDKILGVTRMDLFAGGLNFVFGQAQKPGSAGVISLNRLDPESYGDERDKELFVERATKESIHEIGHTLGLDHCDDRGCVMTFSNSVQGVDEKGSLPCEKCREKLS